LNVWNRFQREKNSPLRLPPKFLSIAPGQQRRCVADCLSKTSTYAQNSQTNSF